jgi:replicative DNA helicase
MTSKRLPAIHSYDDLFERYVKERSNPDHRPIQLGFGTIDAELRGISPGQVLGFCARTAVGKTWWLETVEHNLAAAGIGTLSLSLEMPGVEWAERALSIYADVAPEQIETWAKEGELGHHAGDFLERMQHARVVEQAVDLKDLLGIIEETRKRLTVPLRAVLVDYMGLLRTADRDAYERMSRVAVALKDAAKETNVSLLVAMQLSRAGGNGSEPVTIDMIRDSGAIEESADFLLGGWRPEKKLNIEFEERIQTQDMLRVSMLKNRKGAEGRIVDLRFSAEGRRVVEEADPFEAAI